MADTFPTLIATFFVLAVLILFRRAFSAPRLSFPPGPPSKPLIGNIMHAPTSGAIWEVFSQWKEVYGDLVFLHGLGNNILVVNSLETTNELFEGRWKTYSHRPRFTVVGELMGTEKSPVFMPYGEEWRESRKLINMALNQGAIKRYHTVQEDIAALLNKDLLEKPNDFISHLRLAAGRVVLSVTYGLFAENSQDQYIKDAEEAMDVIGKGMAPGTFLCDYFPIMKHIPTWMPFHWRKEAERGRKAVRRTVELPYFAVKKMFSENSAPPSFTMDLLSLGINDLKSEEQAMLAASAMYGAGTETTFATSLTFVLAMAMNQDIQKKAQLEIDSIIGTDRLPTIADAPQLPYTMAVVKETMRWHPSVPISVPRQTSEDDVFRGYHIPKNTMVIPNVWAISQNTSNPNQFNPDRFLYQNDSLNMIDPSKWIFGIGRRICPGRYLAENSLIAIICGILSAFDILPLQNEPIHPKFSPKHISFPEVFPCQIQPRSCGKVELIHSRSAEAKVHLHAK